MFIYIFQKIVLFESHETLADINKNIENFSCTTKYSGNLRHMPLDLSIFRIKAQSILTWNGYRKSIIKLLDLCQVFENDTNKSKCIGKSNAIHFSETGG